MAITIDMVRPYYAADIASEAECAVGRDEDAMLRVQERYGMPSPKEIMGMGPATLAPTMPTEATPPQTVPQQKVSEQPVQAPVRREGPVSEGSGWLKPKGNILDPIKGAVAGIAQATAGEIDTADWVINKIADIIPGVPRQEIIGKLRDVITPEALDKDEETLTHTIGNALGYGAAQMALLYAL